MASALFVVLCGGGLFLLFAGIGVWLILRYQKNKEKARQSLDWPKTTGRIIESRIAEHESEDEDGISTYTYSPVVRFEYQVAGITYTGDRMGIGPSVAISNRRKVEERIAYYPAGKNVPVFYNPQNPSEAVLEAGKTGKAELVAGIILVVIAVTILCIGSVVLLANSLG
ncbi:hypothetical protein BECAL_03205 [Bellilinea caldifistulae]|uniref:DUF3592 domain-containing protein n=1 Tax=Bellilinea caldifistulae TaxID=360411 RepID=A0A0P6XMB0_9CHLR|nr:DUF3592 domain-containing protein [Bellilinea caldifistulae]KPL76325.1 hypothetical protein AC812_06575 [Bellilinea caldifistulae]GAP12005.1 hypothetical protein BECAL_03205 [Bellilinea caldifistulae]